MAPSDDERNRLLEGVAPLLSAGAIEVVAELPFPPGNLAVDPEGRLYFTAHPEAHPEGAKLWVLDPAGPLEPVTKPRPFPSEAFQAQLRTPLGVRLDAAGRLWVVDHGDYGDVAPTLSAFDRVTGEVLFRMAFPDDVGGSMFNDMAVDSDHDVAYVADPSAYEFEPAIVVVDLREKSSRRVLVEDRSVESEGQKLVVRGKFLKIYGLTLQVDVDTIALSKDGQWLYYGPLNGSKVWRVPTKVLRDVAADADRQAAAVEEWSPKPCSDGAAMDSRGNLYVTAPELDGIVVVGQDRTPRLLVKDPRIAWPDGVALSADEGWLYVTCSQLHDVMGEDPSDIVRKGPFRILRIRLPAP